MAIEHRYYSIPYPFDPVQIIYPFANHFINNRFIIRTFKQGVIHTNHKHPEKHLLRLETLQQSVRFTILGSWEDSDPEATERIRYVHRKCNRLFAPLLKYDSEETPSVGVDEGNSTTLRQGAGNSVVGDAKHTSAAVSHRVWPNCIKNLPVNENQLKEAQHASLYDDLRLAYRRDYDKPFMVFRYGKRALKWWNKISFTSSTGSVYRPQKTKGHTDIKNVRAGVDERSKGVTSSTLI